jgi:hypothetical protein
MTSKKILVSDIIKYEADPVACTFFGEEFAQKVDEIRRQNKLDEECKKIREEMDAIKLEESRDPRLQKIMERIRMKRKNQTQ